MRDVRERPRFPRWLIALLAVVAVGILASGIWFYLEQNQSAHRSAEDNLLAIGRLKTQEIADWRSERLASAANLGESPLFAQAVTRWLTTRQESDANLILARLQVTAQLYRYENLLLVDARGKVLLSTAAPPRTLSSDTLAALKNSLQAGKATLTDLYTTLGESEVRLDVVAPLLAGDNASATPVAALILTENASDFLYPLIQSWPTASPSAETLLVRRDGDQVLYLNELRHEHGTAFKLRFPLTQTTLPAVMAALGERDVVQGKDYRGEKVLAALEAVPDSPWFVVAKVDTSEAFGPTRLRSGLALGLTFVLLVALFAGVGLLWQRGLRKRYSEAYAAKIAHEALLGRFEHLVKQANDIILLGDAEQQIVEANDRALETFGYSRDELLELHLADLVPSEEGHCFAERTGDVSQKGASVHEALARRKDGSRFPVEVSDRWFTLDGKDYLQAIIRDYTLRKKAEDDLLASRERYRATVEAVAQIVWVTDPKGRVAEPLPGFQDYAGLSFAEVQQSGLLGAVHPEDLERVRAVWRQALREGTRYEVECRLRRADGAYRNFWVRGMPVFGPDGKIREWVGACTDVTERRQAEEERAQLERQLEHSQRLESLGVLAGGIAHDFNNLLTAILGNSYLALEAMGPEDPNRPFVKDIYDVGERAARLTRQILAFSRRQVLKPCVLCLNDAITSMEVLLRRTLGEEIDLRFFLSADLQDVEVDPGQMEQVLVNLAVNARDAMPSGGSLIVETAGVVLDRTYARTHSETQPGPYVMLAVTDTGCGMDAETQSRIFEPFFTTKDVGKGTGLGLSTVFGIVKQSGGSLSVYSEPGKGSTFKIYLPAAGASVAPETKPSEETAEPSYGAETILVVEDEVPVRAMVVRALSQNGYRVSEAGSADEVLSILAEGGELPELLLTDVVLPGGSSGPELAETLRVRSPALRVLYMSGYTRNFMVQNGRISADTQFLEKPFTPDKLVRRVREVLANSLADASPQR